MRVPVLSTPGGSRVGPHCGVATFQGRRSAIKAHWASRPSGVTAMRAFLAPDAGDASDGMWRAEYKGHEIY